jgi:hypothetical protein
MNEPKQACKNIASGKYFLFVEETNDKKLFLVIPTGEVKPLNTSLFGEIEEVNITDLLNNGLLTQQQIEGYKKFVEEDSIRLFKEIIRSVEDAEDLLEKLEIAQKLMSKVQYEFALNRLAESVRSTGN